MNDSRQNKTTLQFIKQYLEIHAITAIVPAFSNVFTLFLLFRTRNLTFIDFAGFAYIHRVCIVFEPVTLNVNFTSIEY